MPLNEGEGNKAVLYDEVPHINVSRKNLINKQRRSERGMKGKGKDALAGTPRALAGTGGTLPKCGPSAFCVQHRLKSLNSTRQYPQYPPFKF
jgi:hypothetical protein